MKVLHINSADNEGGAGRAMYRLHQEIERQGHHSSCLVGHEIFPEDGISYIENETRLFRTIIDNIVEPFGRKLKSYFNLDNLSYRDSLNISKTSIFKQSDVIHLHNLHGDYFNIRLLKHLCNIKPVVWTIHDMWPVTGHCAFSYDCERWQSGCYDCPLLKESQKQIVEPPATKEDYTKRIWNLKRSVYHNLPLHIVSPSKWLYDIAKESILQSSATFHCIPNGVDWDISRTETMQSAKRELKLPRDSKVILFSASNTNSNRKGFQELLQCLEKLPEDNSIWLLTTGGTVKFPSKFNRFHIMDLGYIVKEEDLQRAFRAADIFLFPTLAETQGLVIVEALITGTPIVSFDVGGVPDMVHHMKTGYLAKYKDIEDLARGVNIILEDNELRKKMADSCEKLARSHFSLSLQTKNYLEVYKEALAMFSSANEVDKSLKIAFNDIGGNTWTGGITYRKNLLKALREYYPDVKIYIVSKDVDKYDNSEYDKIIEYSPDGWKITRMVHRFFQNKFLYDFKLIKAIQSVDEGVDVLFPADYSAGKKTASILWIPDFQILHLPHFFSNKDVSNYDTLMKQAIKRFPLIVLSSHDAQNDFRKFCPKYIEKTRVMQFVAHIPEDLYDFDPKVVLDKYNLPDRFIYIPNQFWAHKNHLLLLEAMKILKDRGIKLFIVFTGNPTDIRNPEYIIEVLKTITLNGLRDQIALLGFVNHKDVYGLIRQSVCVCNPSLFEGWSTTVEETKSVGKKILLSDLPVHKEQSPPGGVYFDRNNAEDLAENLGKIWEDNDSGPDLEMENNARELLPIRMQKYAETFISIAHEAVRK